MAHRYVKREKENSLLFLGPNLRAFLRACPIDQQDALERYGPSAVHYAIDKSYVRAATDVDGYMIRPIVIEMTAEGKLWLDSRGDV